MTELGIYGGTFNPVHNGHVHAVNCLLQTCKLDRLLLIPTRRPPHKMTAVDDDPLIRLAMLRLAFPNADRADSRLSISEFEIRSDAPSYTALTLQHYADEETHITFFCGTDMFLSLDTWYHPEIVFSSATVAHIPRTHLTEDDRMRIARATAAYEKDYSARILHLKVQPHPLSSTQVRDAIRRGQDIRALVPAPVADYIEQNGLYREVRNDA